MVLHSESPPLIRERRYPRLGLGDLLILFRSRHLTSNTRGLYLEGSILKGIFLVSCLIIN